MHPNQAHDRASESFAKVDGILNMTIHSPKPYQPPWSYGPYYKHSKIVEQGYKF